MSDDPKRIVLSRRARFVAAALASVGGVALNEACSVAQVCLSQVSRDDGGPQPCLEPPYERDAEPQPCLSPLPPDAGDDAETDAGPSDGGDAGDASDDADAG